MTSLKTSIIYRIKLLSENKKLYQKIALAKHKNSSFSLNLYFTSQNYLQKKYSSTKRQYHINIINSIIFDHRIHEVAEFKNNLIWNETSEFLKRYYKKKETIERIPKISEYYEKYTLFSPVYFGHEGLLVIIMNKWTKKKKNYLEYVEDHEDEREQRKKIKKKKSFEPLINGSTLKNINNSNNITSSNNKSLMSKNTLDLTKFENESKKIINDKNKENIICNENKVNDKKKDKSFSEIINDLSSSYSVVINKENNNNNKKNNIINNSNMILNKKKTINLDSIGKTLNISCNKNKNKNISNYIKICLNKKNNAYILTNKNQNLNLRNKNDNNILIPTNKKYQKRALNTNLISYNLQSNDSSKRTIRVNTITNYIHENDKSLKKHNNIIRKKFDFNIQRNKEINYIGANKTINSGKLKDSILKNQSKIIKNKNNKNNILKKINFQKIKINSKPFSKRSELSNSISKLKSLTNRNSPTHSNYNNFLVTNKYQNASFMNQAIGKKIPKINIDILNSKIIKDIKIDSKKLYSEDPFIYKLSRINKKKILPLMSLTKNSSLTPLKNLTQSGINSLTGNNITKIYSKNNITKNKKNLVLGQLNNINDMIYHKKRKILGDYNIRNNSANSSLIEKNRGIKTGINLINSKKGINNWKKNDKNNNYKNINLNLNLNIHFNIDGLEKKNKGNNKLINNTIINQIHDKTKRKM